MGIPLKRLQREIDAPTFALYRAYERLEPWGEEREDWRMGQVCTTVAGSVGTRSKPSDFMLDLSEDADTRKGRELMTHMNYIMTKHNAQFKKKAN